MVRRHLRLGGWRTLLQTSTNLLLQPAADLLGLPLLQLGELGQVDLELLQHQVLISLAERVEALLADRGGLLALQKIERHRCERVVNGLGEFDMGLELAQIAQQRIGLHSEYAHYLRQQVRCPAAIPFGLDRVDNPDPR
jgi:hypothetical protein